MNYDKYKEIIIYLNKIIQLFFIIRIYVCFNKESEFLRNR